MANPTKQCTKCKEIKELNLFYKDSSKKDGLKLWCKSCGKISSNTYYINNKEEIVALKAVYYSKHKEEIAASHAVYRSEHKEELAAYQEVYYQEHREEKAASQAEYAKANPGKVNAKVAKRRAAKLNATPSWLTNEQLLEIQEFYVEAAKLTKLTGILHHVDHIIPLQGKEVKGLHVPWNLRIITAFENLSKGNRVIL